MTRRGLNQPRNLSFQNGLMKVAVNSKLLWIGDADIPEALREAAEGHWDICAYTHVLPLSSQLADATLAVIQVEGNLHRLGPIVSELDQTPVVAVFLLPEDSDHASHAKSLLSPRAGQFICIEHDASAGEMMAAISAAAALQPGIEKLHAELAAARELNATATKSFEQFDEEMRLAARLQRDFLPRRLPEIGNVRFGILYRPAGWLSGDIYDVARLDETHVGFYIADAVGHGMPAALLTMFIKKALQTKRIVGNTYEIVSPEVSLQQLNSDICEQNLSSCQFCTAVYGVFDTASSTLIYSRAGHPEPILLRADGTHEKLSSPGSLLGIFPEERFESRQVIINPGDRLVVYTDGAEDILRCSSKKTIMDVLAPLAGVSRDEMLLQLTAWIDSYLDGDQPEDDITILAMDMLA